MNQVRRYPIDFEALDKGSVISADRLSHIFDEPIDSKDYNFKVMGLKQEIEGYFRDRGETVTVAQVNGDLKVLTDTEAATYNRKTFDASIRRAGKAHHRNLGVDQTMLSENDQKKHERDLIVQGKTLGAIANVRSEIALEANKRKTPTLTGSQE